MCNRTNPRGFQFRASLSSLQVQGGSREAAESAFLKCHENRAYWPQKPFAYPTPVMVPLQGLHNCTSAWSAVESSQPSHICGHDPRPPLLSLGMPALVNMVLLACCSRGCKELLARCDSSNSSAHPFPPSKASWEHPFFQGQGDGRYLTCPCHHRNTS